MWEELKKSYYKSYISNEDGNGNLAFVGYNTQSTGDESLKMGQGSKNRLENPWRVQIN